MSSASPPLADSYRRRSQSSHRLTATAAAAERLLQSTATAAAAGHLPWSTATAAAAGRLPWSTAAAAGRLLRLTASAGRRSPPAVDFFRCQLMFLVADSPAPAPAPAATGAGILFCGQPLLPLVPMFWLLNLSFNCSAWAGQNRDTWKTPS
jgi:hypothetical protein